MAWTGSLLIVENKDFMILVLHPEEASTMQEHCFQGYWITHKVPFLTDAAEVVYAHEEAYDGTGYPRGLKGQQIHLGARIVAVADTLDRTMSKPQSLAEAREEITCQSGKRLDPEVVRIFLQLPDILWEDLRREVDSHP